ncbi:MAG: HEPN domain-containing protein [Armatimonadetes bacterium]|nr:HEPN domain-containing protein [Armatimonadota bacterium]
MATWQEIGVDSFQAARELYQTGRYRSCVSRFYYAAFSVLAHELAANGVAFGDQQETPNHKGMPKLIKLHLPLEAKAKADCIAIIRRLYAARIVADYQRRTLDAAIARDAMRDAAALFRLLGVDYG